MAPDDQHDGIVCPVCHDPVVPVDYWATIILPVLPYAGQWTTAHVLCLWALQVPVE